MSGHRLTSASFARFALAGNATFTIKGRTTRYTYRVRASRDGKAHFVAVLSGPDNTHDYQFIGTVLHGRFVPRRGAPPAPSAVAFGWVWERRQRLDALPCEVWHEGRCGKCGRVLTVPESLILGLGPECAQMSLGGMR